VQWRQDASIKEFLTTSRKIVQFSSGKAPAVRRSTLELYVMSLEYDY